MPQYEFSAFLVVNADNEAEAHIAAASAIDHLERLNAGAYLSLDDGDPIDITDEA